MGRDRPLVRMSFAIFYLKGVTLANIDVRTIDNGVFPFLLLQLLVLTLIFV